MRWHTIDYRKRDGERRRVVVNRGFWLDLPRLMLLCRLLGHRPVVDGVDYGGYADRPVHRSRWVVCDRCGIRTEPQRPLDGDLVVGQPYTGPLPGPFPERPTGTVGGQLVLGRSVGTGIELKVGNPGSEQVLAVSLNIHPVLGLYLHTENHGRSLQRRLNPTGYQSRVIEVRASDGRLRWRLWANRDEHRSDTPRWQDGSIRIDPRDLVLGEARFSYENVGDPVAAAVRMPHGDDHQVVLQLQRQTHGRRRGHRRRHTWSVDIDAPGGIPTKPGDHGRITGFAVAVTDEAVQDRGWPAQACAEAAARLTRDRIRYGYQPAKEAAGA